MTARRTGFVLALATVSGAVALLYEVALFRTLGLVFGIAVHAAAAVVGTFLFGLGTGAAAGGRALSRRAPLRTYGFLELGLAVFGYAAPFLLFRALDEGAVARGLGADAAGAFPLRALLGSFLVLLPPTLLMGATFPVLARALEGDDEAGTARRLGALYGLNTLGAALGAVAAAFVVLPALGLFGAFHLAAGANVVLGLVAIFGMAGGESDATGDARESGERAPLPALLCAAVLALGFAAIALQILGNRLLLTLIGGTVYAFGTVLGVFLLGVAVGGVAGGTLAARAAAPWRLLAALALLFAAGIGLGAWLLRLRCGDEDPFAGAANLAIFDTGGAGLTRLAHLQGSLGLAALAFLPAALASGAFLSASFRLTDRERRSASLGWLYFWNTLGAVAGSLAAAFALLPWLGLRASLLLLAAVAAVAGAALALRAGRPTATHLALAAAAALLLWLGLRPGTAPGTAQGLRTLFYREAAASAVKVEEVDDAAEPEPVRLLRVNGAAEASSLFIDRRLQLLLGFLTTLPHPDPRRALCIGLGTGMTSGALAVSSGSLDVAELSLGVIEACPLFARWNADLLGRPGVRVVNDDGRRFLARGGEPYDAISADPVHPWIAGTAHMYSLQYDRLARGRLAPGGIMTQWIPLYDLAAPDVGGIVLTFSKAFPHVSAWMTGYDLALLGSEEPLALDLERIGRRMREEPMRSMLASVGVRSPADLLAVYCCGDAGCASLAALAPQPIRDERPWLEFTAPLAATGSYSTEVMRQLLACADPLPVAGDRSAFDAARAAYRADAARFVAAAEARRGIAAARTEFIAAMRRGYGGD